MNVVNSILNNIQNKISVKDLLDLLPIDQIPEEKSEQLLIILINQCSQFNDVDNCRLIIDTFNNKRSALDPLPTFIFLFQNRNVSEDVLKFLIFSFPEKTTQSMYEDLINLHTNIPSKGDEIALFIADRLISFINETPDWKLLFRMMELDEDDDDIQEDKPKLKQFFKEKIIVKRPEWIKDFPKINVNDIKIPLLPNILNFIDLHTSPFVLPKYNVACYVEKVMMLYPYKKDIDNFEDIKSFDESDLFHELGPDNKERMLDVLKSSRCDICRFRIHNPRWVLKCPLLKGGWSGSYCSFDCLKSVDEDEDILYLIGNMIEQIKHYSIRC